MFYEGFLVPLIKEGKIEVEALVFSMMIFGALLFFWFIRLTIKIEDKGIIIHYFPFNRESHKWDEIEKVEVAEYPYANKGVRWSEELGIVYSLQGYKGVHIRFKNGEKCYVSSLNAQMLLKEIEKRIAQLEG
ncbi:hypothetical protein JCM31826_06840 [Thermaurantimonas aggregans]|uniref:PH domain-containing protein n=2 Tax=Thermaurantimonas aggregans TaxID=2173829 RepID=A0A401XJL5_9FLAO|nr:hypothetical protein JCM31826_06840 [Thermaurantimonas aggregans]